MCTDAYNDNCQFRLEVRDLWKGLLHSTYHHPRRVFAIGLEIDDRAKHKTLIKASILTMFIFASR